MLLTGSALVAAVVGVGVIAAPHLRGGGSAPQRAAGRNQVLATPNRLAYAVDRSLLRAQAQAAIVLGDDARPAREPGRSRARAGAAGRRCGARRHRGHDRAPVRSAALAGARLRQRGDARRSRTPDGAAPRALPSRARAISSSSRICPGSRAASSRRRRSPPRSSSPRPRPTRPSRRSAGWASSESRSAQASRCSPQPTLGSPIGSRSLPVSHRTATSRMSCCSRRPARTEADDGFDPYRRAASTSAWASRARWRRSCRRPRPSGRCFAELRELDPASGEPLAPFRARSLRRARRRRGERPRAPRKPRPRALRRSLRGAARPRPRDDRGAVAAASRRRAPRAGRDRDRSARQVLPGSRVARPRRASPHVRLTVTSLLAHATPRLQPPLPRRARHG